MKKIQDRIHRIEGQLRSVEAAIGNDAACEEVVPQLLAIKGAVNGVLEAYLTTALDDCVGATDTKRMQRLISTLLKHS